VKFHTSLRCISFNEKSVIQPQLCQLYYLKYFSYYVSSNHDMPMQTGGKRWCSSNPLATRQQKEVNDQHQARSLLPRERDLLPFVPEAGWTSVPVWTTRNISAALGPDLRTYMPVWSPIPTTLPRPPLAIT
jgi:hypothetical protein